MAVNLRTDVLTPSGALPPTGLTEIVTPAQIRAAGLLVIDGAGSHSLWMDCRFASPVLAQIYLKGATSAISFVVSNRDQPHWTFQTPVDKIALSLLSALPVGGIAGLPQLPSQGSDYFNNNQAGGYLLITGTSDLVAYGKDRYQPPNVAWYSATDTIAIGAGVTITDALSATIVPRSITGLDIYNPGTVLIRARWRVQQATFGGDVRGGYVDAASNLFPIMPSGAESIDLEAEPGSYLKVDLINGAATAGSYALKVRGY